MPVAIVPVLAQPPKGENILPRGIEELVAITEKNLDAAVRDSELAVKKYDLKSKRLKAQALTLGAATSGVAVGAIPISFPDAAILTPIEATLISAIARVYKLDEKDDFTKKLISRIVESGTVGIVAKMALNQLKLIPGLANLAADVLNAIVAGAIIAGIGEAATIIMEKAYLGEINKEDFEWINRVVEEQMGTIVKKITKFTSEHMGSINITDIIKAILSRK